MVCYGMMVRACVCVLVWQAHTQPATQNLFGIIQGGLDLQLRKQCVEAMVQRNLPGYAIGGLSGGEDKNSFWRVVKETAALLPPDKPRYCMGVGYGWRSQTLVPIASGPRLNPLLFSAHGPSKC